MCFHPRSSWLLHKKSVNQTGTGLAPTPAAAPPPAHHHTHPHACGQGWPGRGSHLFTGQRANVQEEAAGDLPHHDGQMQDLSG